MLVENDPVVGPLANAQDLVGVRTALRKVGVQRIIVKPVADGWDFEGLADLSRLVNNRGKSEGPFEAQCTQRDVEGRPGCAGASPSAGGLGGPPC